MCNIALCMQHSVSYTFSTVNIYIQKVCKNILMLYVINNVPVMLVYCKSASTARLFSNKETMRHFIWIAKLSVYYTTPFKIIINIHINTFLCMQISLKITLIKCYSLPGYLLNVYFQKHLINERIHVVNSGIFIVVTVLSAISFPSIPTLHGIQT